MELIITSTYGTLSRGRHSARQGNGRSAQWAAKNAKGQLVVGPGVWQLHCSDGFRREARAVLTIDEDGGWEMEGDTERFFVVE